MEYFELTHTEERNGYTIKLYTTWEDSEIDWDFETEDERMEVCSRINNGSLLYFIAKVTASKAGVELAQDYLGGCCYESINEFLKDGYYKDMVENVCFDASKKIVELALAA